MRKIFFLIGLPFLLMAATTYQTRTVNQSWKLDTPSINDQLDPISGKWEVINSTKVNLPVLTQSVKYADFPKVLFKDHDFYDFDATAKVYISSENQDTQAGGLVLRYRNLYSFYMLF